MPFKRRAPLVSLLPSLALLSCTAPPPLPASGEGASICAADPSTTPTDQPQRTLLSRRIEGLAIRPNKGGGRAKRQTLGTLAATPRARHRRIRDAHGHFGGDQIGEAYGIGGLGTSGYGSGGGGYGGGSGVGSMMGGPQTSEGRATSARERFDLEVDPWAYAEIALPYRSGVAGRFEPRRDTRVNTTVDAKEELLSTFAVDVDTASYSIARRALNAGRIPEPTLVRVEELVNYFHYDYDPPRPGEGLFSIQADGARSPVEPNEHLLRIGIQAQVVSDEDRLPANLVFLVDTSCSMTPPDRLELAKRGLEIAVDHLGKKDTVAITTYAGGVELILPPTPADEKAVIKSAIRRLHTGGGTAMASGLTLAYQQAVKALRDGVISRIIVCSDGDANIGATTPEEMLKQLAGYVSEGVTLSTIGFGDGNYKDQVMEILADKGNGNYFYVDTERQAERVFGRDLTKMIQDVAQDVKIQVAFDASSVKRYRLIGYENRNIANRDFRNDRVDAGEIGAGHQVTAFYALELTSGAAGKLATVRVRAKRPRALAAKEHALEVPIAVVNRPFARAPGDLRFGTAVVGAAEILRRSQYASPWSFSKVIAIAEEAGAQSDDIDRAEFIGLMERARRIAESTAAR